MSSTNEHSPRGIPEDVPSEGQPEGPMSFRLEELRPWCVSAYQAAGMSEVDASAVVENQLWTDCRGVDTHGFQRVSWYINWFRDGSTDPKAQLNIPNIVKKTLDNIGYNNEEYGFSSNSCNIMVFVACRHYLRNIICINICRRA